MREMKGEGEGDLLFKGSAIGSEEGPSSTRSSYAKRGGGTAQQF
jgi:hypothetical protein